MVVFTHDVATQAAPDYDDVDGLAVRASDVDALLTGRIDLTELTERAWARCGLALPAPF